MGCLFHTPAKALFPNTDTVNWDSNIGTGGGCTVQCKDTLATHSGDELHLEAIWRLNSTGIVGKAAA